MNGVEQVQALYVGYYGRAADPDGLAYWNYQLSHGMPLGNIAASFSVQAESKALYPFLNGNGNASAFVDQVYMNLFNRVPDSGGKQYWMDYLIAASGNPESISLFILSVINGAQGNDVAVVQNKVDAAEYFTSSVQAAEIENTVHLNGMPVLAADFVTAAKGVVDNEVTGNVFTLQDSAAETIAYIDAHTETKVLIETVEKIVEKIVIQTEIVEVEKIVFQDKIVLVDKIVEVPVEVIVPFPVPGPVQTIVQEPPHVLSITLNSVLPDSSTKDYAGVQMNFGSGNTPNNWATVLDHTSGELFGFKVHERQGPDVLAVAGTNGIEAVWTMAAGAQPGNPDRSLASIDLLLDFGVGKPDNGEFIFAFDIDPTAQVNYINYKLTEVGGNWAMLNPAGTSGQGMTIGNDGHTLSDSFNLGFAFTGVPNGAAVGTGDVLAGAYNFRLISMVGVNEVASFDGQLVLV